MSLRFFSLSSMISINSLAIKLLLVERQSKRECTAFANCAFDPNLPAMQLDKLSSERYPESRPFVLCGIIGAHLTKLFKNRLLVFGGNAAARVAHGYFHHFPGQRGIDVDMS